MPASTQYLSKVPLVLPESLIYMKIANQQK